MRSALKVTIALAAVVGTGLDAIGNVFVIPLPTGPYPYALPGVSYLTTGYSQDFDLGTQLQSVQSVTLNVHGSVTAGVDYSGSPFGEGFEAYLGDDPSVWFFATTPAFGGGTWPNSQNFNSSVTFGPFGYGLHNQPDWTSLLDGRSHWYFEIHNDPAFPETPHRTEPFGTISSAEIIIVATPAPEPESLALLGGFAAMLLLKRRSQLVQGLSRLPSHQ